jgi:DNA modification methylase
VLQVKTFLNLTNTQKRALPPEFASEDVRYTEDLVEHFLGEFTKEGDIVLDPFMGYGTTLLVAERMNREAYGIEFDSNRWKYVQTILKAPERAILGDSRKLQDMSLPKFDFSITSPPYMGKHHTENPFTTYSTEGAGYEQYLRDLKDIYRQLKEKLNPDAHVVVEVSNLKHENNLLTLLAWDIARALSDVLRFNGEVVITWQESYGFGYDHSYCLIFQNS